MSPFTVFLVASFTEMYGIVLTVYLLGSWLGAQIPLLRDTHAGGHLWNDLGRLEHDQQHGAAALLVRILRIFLCTTV